MTASLQLDEVLPQTVRRPFISSRGCMFKQIFFVLLKSQLILFLFAGMLFSQIPGNGQLFEPGTIRVLILSGQNSHDWRTTTPFLRQLLVGTGRFDVRVCESPAGMTHETLTPFDVLLDDYSGPRLGSATEKAIENFIKSGKGLVVVHRALNSFSGLEVVSDHPVTPPIKEPPWPEFAKMIKGYWPAQPPGGFHAPPHFFEVKIIKGDHPVVQGLKTSFKTADDLYHGLTFLPGAEVIAAAYDDPKNGGTGKDEPLIFSSSYGKGRVFCTALGHDVASMQAGGFIATFLRGTEWAATGKVTLPPDQGMPGPGPNAVRALVITGGHDHESSFYSLFDGYPDLAWTPVSTASVAFQNDLRNKYDVLVLYDFTRDLDETGKKNLRDFVESGKGVVILHHAILSYQTWPWWYGEVAGGRYRLDRDGDIPSSTATMGQEHFVLLEGQHPVTAGLRPFHIWDEPYKGMWISAKNKVLLTTDNTASDRPLAWISAYPKSRVFYTQLGHDHTAFQHPAYRMLIHQAILWSAGRKN
jgi:type 1 glutamine amidotransferase